MNLFLCINIYTITLGPKMNNSKIDLLVIFPCNSEVFTDISKITDYDSMQAYFIYSALRQLTLEKNIVCIGYDDLWLPKSCKNKITFDQFITKLKKRNIKITDCCHVLITKLNSSKQFGNGFLDSVLESISGNVYKFEDKNIRVFDNPRLITIGHYSKGPEEANFINAGLAIPTDIFYPQQIVNNRVYKVHVDHNYPGVANCFSEIKQVLHGLENRIQEHPDWDKLEVIYHTLPTKIDNIGHFETTNICINNLSKIYGQCHLAFLSHRESLGQYPFELCASGVNVIILKKNLLSGDVMKDATAVHRISVDEFNYFLFLNKTFIKTSININSKSVEDMSYLRYVQNFLEAMFS
jgi:hypothetical protein